MRAKVLPAEWAHLGDELAALCMVINSAFCSIRNVLADALTAAQLCAALCTHRQVTLQHSLPSYNLLSNRTFHCSPSQLSRNSSSLALSGYLVTAVVRCFSQNKSKALGGLASFNSLYSRESLLYSYQQGNEPAKSAREHSRKERCSK